MKRAGVLLSAAVFFRAGFVFAGIQFGQADVSRNDEILFTVRHELPGTASYSALFSAAISGGEVRSAPEVLTSYPEQLELLSGGAVLQIRSRYGTARCDTRTKSVSWRQTAATVPVNSMRLAPYSVSPDGNWMCYVEKTGCASGVLTLESVRTGKKTALDSGAAFSYTAVPVKWLDDSSVFVYEKDRSLYFCRPDAVERGMETGDEFRRIGAGRIASVNWCGGKYLVYVDGDLIYRIRAKELYTLGLYAGIIGNGKAVGRLPFQFDPDKDTFRTDARVSAMALIQGGNVFHYYKIRSGGCDYIDVAYSRPFIDRKASLLDARIIWPDGAPPALWVRLLPYSGGEPAASVYRLSDRLERILNISGSGGFYVSPDGGSCAFSAGSAVYVYDTRSWERKAELLCGEAVVSMAWGKGGALYIGGDRTVRVWNTVSGESGTLALSSAAGGLWGGEPDRIIVRSDNGGVYVFDRRQRIWTEGDSSAVRAPAAQNGRYRVFCGTTAAPRFENALYVRTLSGKPVTRAVYPDSIRKADAAPKAALAFDAYDNADGLARILYELDLYGVPATFFLNGEFIRRYPQETRQIAASGADCASMFFTAADLTARNFIADEEFIRRGLARNEDEFYRCTERELSLLWHAPYYRVTADIAEAGAKAGYAYAAALSARGGQDSGGGSGAVSAGGGETSAGEKSAGPQELIDGYMRALRENGGGIVSVPVGPERDSGGERLYGRLDLLISAILDGGFDIVPVREAAD